MWAVKIVVTQMWAVKIVVTQMWAVKIVGYVQVNCHTRKFASYDFHTCIFEVKGIKHPNYSLFAL